MPSRFYSQKDIDTFYEGDLAEKLKASLKYFKELEIKGVVQGDLMFTSKDLRNETLWEIFWMLVSEHDKYLLPWKL